jgi:hypothetical protein
VDGLLREHPEIVVRVINDSRGKRRRAARAPVLERRGGQASGSHRMRALLAGIGAVLVLGIAVAIWRWPRTQQTAPPPRATPSLPAPDAGPSIAGLAVEPHDRSDPLAAAGLDGLDGLDMPALLARAGKYLDEGLKSDDGRHLSYPDGDNAIDLYREVLRRDPGNSAAEQGLARIAAFYARGAQKTFDRGLDTFTQELVEKGLRANPDDATLLKLKADTAARAGAQRE